MTTKTEALKLALKALKLGDTVFYPQTSIAIAAIECVLAQPEQEPVAWEGGEGWESLAWELCADENGEEACNELIWEGGPIPEPWGDRWMKYEGEAKRLIALVQKHTTPPQRTWVGLTNEEINDLVHNHDDFDGLWEFTDAVEAKLKEKNT